MKFDCCVNFNVFNVSMFCLLLSGCIFNRYLASTLPMSVLGKAHFELLNLKLIFSHGTHSSGQ